MLENTEPSERWMHIVIGVAGDGGPTRRVAGAMLLGSPNRPGTMLTLQPGEIAAIHAGDLVNVSPDEGNWLTALPQLFYMRASVWVSLNASFWAEPVGSINSIPVTLRRSQAR